MFLFSVPFIADLPIPFSAATNADGSTSAVTSASTSAEDAQDGYFEPSLVLAARFDNVLTLQALVDSGADISVTDHRGYVTAWRVAFEHP